MLELLAGLEASGLARFLKASFFTYPLISALHVTAVGGLVTLVMLIDLGVLVRLGPANPNGFPQFLRRTAFVLFPVALASGFILFTVQATHYAAMPLFWAKMGLIVLAMANFLVFWRIDRNRSLAERAAAAAKASAALSIAIWIGVLLAGRFLGFLA